MADLSITAANVVAGSGAKKATGTAGAAITAGQVVYFETATSSYKLADTDSATAAVRSPAGIALHGAASGQPLTVLTSGPVTIGATVAVGDVYYLSGTAGGLAPFADVAAGDYPCIIGICTSTSVLNVKIQEAGAVKV
jgi:Uncharacterized conserved protein (DUF2190)